MVNSEYVMKDEGSRKGDRVRERSGEVKEDK